MPITTYMLIDGRNGGSTDPNHLGWFEIGSMQFGAGVGVDVLSGTASTPSFSQVNVQLAGAAAGLLADLTSATPISSIRIEQVDGTGAVVYDLRLGNVLLTGDSFSASNGIPSTTLSLQYGQLGFTSPTSSFGYDVAAGAPMPVASIPAPVVAGPDGLETAAATHYYLVFSDSAGPVGGVSKGWIELSSLQFGADRSSPIGGGGSTTSLEPVTVSFSGLSTQLLTTLAARDTLDAVQIQGVSDKGALVYDLRLGDVVLSADDVSGGGFTPSTSLTLSYDRIGLITAGSSFGYDRTPGTAIDPTTLPALTKSGSDIVDSSAVTKYVMAIDGFNGGSVNAVSKGWFEIDGLQFGVGTAVSIASGAPAASLPTFTEATVSLAGLSPALFSELAARDGVASVQVRGLNATNDVIYDLRLGEVLITGNSIGGSFAGETPSSSLNLNYGRIGLTTTEGSFGYDLVNKTSIAANAIAAPVLSTIDVLETTPVAHYYLLINDGNAPVSGTSKAWFEIDVLQWGAGLSVGDLPGRTPGPASLSELTVVFKGTSPDLLGTLVLGNNLNSIQVQGVDSKGALVYDLRLADVYLTNDSVSASGDTPYTSLSFAYDRIGLITPGGNSFGYDRTPGVTIDPNTLPTLTKAGPDYIETAAATKYFMAIDGYNGGSVNAISKGWFEISSLQFGAATGVALGGTPSAPDFGEVQVSVTGVSPALLGELATGDGVSSVWVRGVDTGTNSVIYDLRLGNASLTSNDFKTEDGTLVSNLAFSYGSIGLTTPGRSFGYELGSGTTISPSAIPTPTTPGPDVLETGAVAHYYLLIDNGGGPPTGDSKGRIEIDSLELRTSNGPAANDTRLSELQIELQSLSPILLGKLATGTHIASVQVQGVDGKGAVVYDLRLGDALISGYSVSAGDGTKVSLSFAYDRIGVITPSGGFGYDVVLNESILPTSIPAPNTAVAPTVTAFTAAVSEDGPTFSQNLLTGASDANPGTTLTVQNLDASVTTSGGRVLTLGSDYTLTGSTLALTTAGFNKFDSLAAAQTDQAVVHFSVSDGGLNTPNTLALTVNGVDDKAVLGSAAVSVAETNAPITTGGTLTIVDLDGPAAFVAQPATAGKYGAFTVGADGQWTYKANLAFDYLNPGDSLTDTFQVKSSDGGTSSVSVTINGTVEVGTVRLGNAPVVQSGAGGQWAQAWTQAGYVIEHKADATNAAEAWSAVKFNAVSAQLISGGDISGGDLGVSGQSAATSTVRQEIDGREVLRISLPNAATSVTVGLTRLFTNDDGSSFSESGLLRLLNASGQVVAEKAFWGDAANGLKTVTLDAAGGFTAMELLAGAYNGAGNFVYGGYSNAAGAFGSAVYTDGAGAAHGSEFLLDRVEFAVPLVGISPTAVAGDFAPG